MSFLLPDTVLKNWIYGLSAEEREEFVNILFGTLQSTGATTLDELTANKFSMMTNISKTLSAMPVEKQQVLNDVICRFAYSSGETFADNVQEKLFHNPHSDHRSSFLKYDPASRKTLTDFRQKQNGCQGLPMTWHHAAWRRSVNSLPPDDPSRFPKACQQWKIPVWSGLFKRDHDAGVL